MFTLKFCANNILKNACYCMSCFMCLLFCLQEEIIFNEKQVYTLVSNCE